MLYHTPAEFDGISDTTEWPLDIEAQRGDYHGLSIVKILTESALACCIITPELQEQPDVHILQWTRNGPAMTKLKITGSQKADIAELRRTLDQERTKGWEVRAALAALKQVFENPNWMTSEQPKSKPGDAPPTKRARRT